MLKKKTVFILELIIMIILIFGCNKMKSNEKTQEYSFEIENKFWNEYYTKNSLTYTYPLSLNSDFCSYVSGEIF